MLHLSELDCEVCKEVIKGSIFPSLYRNYSDRKLLQALSHLIRGHAPPQRLLGIVSEAYQSISRSPWLPRACSISRSPSALSRGLAAGRSRSPWLPRACSISRSPWLPRACSISRSPWLPRACSISRSPWLPRACSISRSPWLPRACSISRSPWLPRACSISRSPWLPRACSISRSPCSTGSQSRHGRDQPHNSRCCTYTSLCCRSRFRCRGYSTTGTCLAHPQASHIGLPRYCAASPVCLRFGKSRSRNNRRGSSPSGCWSRRPATSRRLAPGSWNTATVTALSSTEPPPGGTDSPYRRGRSGRNP